MLALCAYDCSLRVQFETGVYSNDNEQVIRVGRNLEGSRELTQQSIYHEVPNISVTNGQPH